VRPDGSNLEECLEDALQATREEGLPGSSRHAKERCAPTAHAGCIRGSS
jgi:hypothetical protein